MHAASRTILELVKNLSSISLASTSARPGLQSVRSGSLAANPSKDDSLGPGTLGPARANSASNILE